MNLWKFHWLRDTAGPSVHPGSEEVLTGAAPLVTSRSAFFVLLPSGIPSESVWEMRQKRYYLTVSGEELSIFPALALAQLSNQQYSSRGWAHLSKAQAGLFKRKFQALSSLKESKQGKRGLGCMLVPTKFYIFFWKIAHK